MARSDNQDTIWPITPHTAAKHDLLRSYLGAWYAILGTWNKRVLVIDGFAGPGVYRDGEPGSPALVVRTLLDHSAFPRMSNTEFVFIFNESDGARFAELERTVAGLNSSGQPLPANVKVQLFNEEFADLAESIIAKLNGRAMAPTFAFLDPFGFSGVPIELISQLLSSDQSELFIYFHQNNVNRFATAGNVDAHMQALFGTDEYLEAPPAGDPDREKFFHDLYERQLRVVGKFPYVRSFEMVNSSGHTGHYLFYCTRHLTGLKKMKAAMWRIDPLGDFRFSDALAGDSVLFTPEPDLRSLRRTLEAHFAGQTVTVEQVSDYVAEFTPFADSHFKSQLKAIQLEGGLTSPNQRRRGTFPNGTSLTFG